MGDIRKILIQNGCRFITHSPTISTLHLNHADVLNGWSPSIFGGFNQCFSFFHSVNTRLAKAKNEARNQANSQQSAEGQESANSGSSATSSSESSEDSYAGSVSGSGYGFSAEASFEMSNMASSMSRAESSYASSQATQESQGSASSQGTSSGVSSDSSNSESSKVDSRNINTISEEIAERTKFNSGDLDMLGEGYANIDGLQPLAFLLCCSHQEFSTWSIKTFE
jgi:hypothetical protein